MKWLVDAVRSQAFFYVATFFALAGLCELAFGQTISWLPVWVHVLMMVGGVAGVVISLLADRFTAHNASSR